ncbi:uncharacterized protein CELE_F18E3.13 [Caenorhabditis elegans]|uniref:Uncharacterized protein n=1 Tax=Caenorhabditis elegans TaxID=6239 RepID=A3FPJ5_CAEEL|nr:Uncharacterized protein CELE_F18E3.13 [Caenorhabditis elegans]CCD69667.1 Uncharacterized protein CELE_F18E3.13 [Caenorhabditis elegans]|eukprot:NP_001122923.1 Uncharacterized protein CELE_F18E3.13 [Caenorhabditis elegans]
MKMSNALVEIVSEFSGFQHLHTSASSPSIPTTPVVSRKSSSLDAPRHSLNITVGVVEMSQITRNNSATSLNDFNCALRKNSSASYLIIE